MPRMLTSILRGEAGVVGGIEALPFGVLVFVVGSLIATNAWGVVDAKMATATAARQGARAYVEAPAGADAAALGRAAARQALVTLGRRHRPPDIDIAGTFRRCARVSVTVAYDIPAIRLPWVQGLGSVTARATASEIVDPLRSGLAGEADCV